MRSLEGRVAIVTGAGSVGPGWGNGKATAVLLAREGASVFLIDVVRAAAAETEGIIAGEGGTSVAHRCDMLAADEVEHAVQACMARFGAVDILVNNVGGSHPGTPADMPEEVWDRQIDYNLKTAFLGCKYVLPVMEARGRGAIVNVSSVAGLRILAGRSHVAYTASKAGLGMLTKVLALELAEHGILVNAVAPGEIATPMTGMDEAEAYHEERAKGDPAPALTQAAKGD